MGEVAWILQQVEGTWGGFDYYQNLTMDTLYGSWASAWWAQAQTLLTSANDTTNNWDDMSRMNSYWKAANYIYAGEDPVLLDRTLRISSGDDISWVACRSASNNLRYAVRCFQRSTRSSILL